MEFSLTIVMPSYELSIPLIVNVSINYNKIITGRNPRVGLQNDIVPGVTWARERDANRCLIMIVASVSCLWWFAGLEDKQGYVWHMSDSCRSYRLNPTFIIMMKRSLFIKMYFLLALLLCKSSHDSSVRNVRCGRNVFTFCGWVSLPRGRVALSLHNLATSRRVLLDRRVLLASVPATRMEKPCKYSVIVERHYNILRFQHICIVALCRRAKSLRLKNNKYKYRAGCGLVRIFLNAVQCCQNLVSSSCYINIGN